MRFRLGRRRAQPAAPDSPPVGAPPLATDDNDHAGHALRAPSALHAFNRYEIKYLVPSDQLSDVRDELHPRLDPDQHGGADGYSVTSLYYDTRQLRFYWEKIEGLRFRRKVRIRHYGDRAGITDDTVVFVEIKQRVNRVTQKRRIAIPYQQARLLCDDRQMVDCQPGQRAFLNEVLGLVCGFDLVPTATTAYQREAYIGRDADVGLRVTLDHRVRGRDRDFHLAAAAENRLIVPAWLSVLEVKANDRVPYWLTDLAARLNLSIVRMSKYCQSVEAFGRAPRSIFHVPADPAEALAPAAPLKA
ncbi:polyphosphate polymerase domain-containing protein [Virgisporangium aurantiacum]|uniref:VTC domain-containing protein n=1 Tax=Virgisporangium aurantiacum TaxID=175570 RepID=A0A8J4E7I1_9ACTN|nr:polyphosphate polymerase domain-containing protein [Virgisporangium aurantiacum]GIJ64329.1 VTC domain-containing protein [Virgisporangium aurantiacum]